MIFTVADPDLVLPFPPSTSLLFRCYHALRSQEPSMPTLFRAIVLASLFASAVAGQTAPSSSPLRIGIAGLVHGHVSGFLQQNQHRSDIQIVGIAETDKKLSEFIERRNSASLRTSSSRMSRTCSTRPSHKPFSSTQIRSIIARSRGLRTPWHSRHDGKATCREQRRCARHAGRRCSAEKSKSS